MNFDRHDTHMVLSAGSKNGVTICELPKAVGEVGFVSAAIPPHTATDGSGFYNGDRYRRRGVVQPGLSRW